MFQGFHSLRLPLVLCSAYQRCRPARCFSAQVEHLRCSGVAGFAADHTESRFFRLPASFLLLEAVLLPAPRGSVPLPVALERLSQLGFHFGRGRFRAGLRLLGLRIRLSWRCTGGAFPWRLSCRFRPGGRAAARIARSRQRERELESSAYCT